MMPADLATARPKAPVVRCRWVGAGGSGNKGPRTVLPVVTSHFVGVSADGPFATDGVSEVLYQPFPLPGMARAHVWHHVPETRRPRHFHTEPELNLIAAGSGAFGVGDSTSPWRRATSSGGHRDKTTSCSTPRQTPTSMSSASRPSSLRACLGRTIWPRSRARREYDSSQYPPGWAFPSPGSPRPRSSSGHHESWPWRHRCRRPEVLMNVN